MALAILITAIFVGLIVLAIRSLRKKRRGTLTSDPDVPVIRVCNPPTNVKVVKTNN